MLKSCVQDLARKQVYVAKTEKNKFSEREPFFVLAWYPNVKSDAQPCDDVSTVQHLRRQRNISATSTSPERC